MFNNVLNSKVFCESEGSVTTKIVNQYSFVYNIKRDFLVSFVNVSPALKAGKTKITLLLQIKVSPYKVCCHGGSVAEGSLQIALISTLFSRQNTEVF